MINKENLFREKAGISYLEILILVVSLFAFSYFVYEGNQEIDRIYKKNPEIEKLREEKVKNNFLVRFIKAWFGRSRINLVSAEEVSWNCCPKSKDRGAICQDFASVNCDELCSVDCLPAKCEDVSICEVGCCIDEEEGLCSPKSTKQKCEEEGGRWSDRENCDIQECRLGCCVLGSNVEFVTEKRCEKLSAFYGSDEVDYRPNIATEIECLALSYQQVKGACIIETENDAGEIERSCKFLTAGECSQLTGDSLNFYERAN